MRTFIFAFHFLFKMSEHKKKLVAVGRSLVGKFFTLKCRWNDASHIRIILRWLNWPSSMFTMGSNSFLWKRCIGFFIYSRSNRKQKLVAKSDKSLFLHGVINKPAIIIKKTNSRTPKGNLPLLRSVSCPLGMTRKKNRHLTSSSFLVRNSIYRMLSYQLWKVLTYSNSANNLPKT